MGFAPQTCDGEEKQSSFHSNVPQGNDRASNDLLVRSAKASSGGARVGQFYRESPVESKRIPWDTKGLVFLSVLVSWWYLFRTANHKDTKTRRNTKRRSCAKKLTNWAVLVSHPRPCTQFQFPIPSERRLRISRISARSARSLIRPAARLARSSPSRLITSTRRP